VSIVTVRRNERRKLSAAFCNTIAAAFLTVGVLAPSVAIVLNVQATHGSITALSVMFVVAMAISGACHLGGRQILERLEE
jgi:hypothetical protein